MTARMWVDPKARLSILVEAEGEVNPCILTGYQKMRGTEINDRWEFGMDLDEAQFKPEIPEGYEALGLPASVKAGAALYGVGLASVPVVVVATRRSRRRRG